MEFYKSWFPFKFVEVYLTAYEYTDSPRFNVSSQSRWGFNRNLVYIGRTVFALNHSIAFDLKLFRKE